jgi:hypothetical protein
MTSFFRQHEEMTAVINWIAGGTVVATLVGWLPSIAAAFSIVWIGMQIYDRVKNGPKR